MLTIVAFIGALGLLIAVHEYGHYRVAVWCGVKVLRFSVGFGKVIFRWQPKGSPTEFVLGAFPLGGYVKMLDEREATVLPHEKHLAFNNQRLRSRVAIVAAGPLANLLLAVLLYAIVNWGGVEQPKAVLASPTVGSVADRAGIFGGEQVIKANFDGSDARDIESFEGLRWLLTRGALEGRDVRLTVAAGAGGKPREVVLRLSEIESKNADAQMFQKIGITGPLTRPVVGEVMKDGAAFRSGLRQGDLVLELGGNAIVDGLQLRELIRATGKAGDPAAATWVIDRNGSRLELTVTPDKKRDGDGWIGKIGAYIGAPPEFVTVRYGFVSGLWRGVTRTWEVSALTLRMMGKMLIGESSLKNLSGPLTIADYAGKSASLGLTQYLVFLALISVSLGVLNLLPLPVLDGGHLMYYLWEGVTGSAVSDIWMERLQRGGVVALMSMMLIAVFNDVTRILG
ncbi:MAG: hypothetical protein RIS34_850 [Pseudomonadota bacterium]|jgi:regulator of sigma E protease